MCEAVSGELSCVSVFSGSLRVGTYRCVVHVCVYIIVCQSFKYQCLILSTKSYLLH